MFWRSPHFAAQRCFRRQGLSKAVSGFSLVEVVLAVGITAFILIAVFGMVTVAVKGTREADLMARLTEITRREAALCQLQPLTNVTGRLPATNYYTGWCIPCTIDSADFQVDLMNVTPAGTSSNLAFIQLQIRWPVPQLSFTNTSIISVAKYD